MLCSATTTVIYKHKLSTILHHRGLWDFRFFAFSTLPSHTCTTPGPQISPQGGRFQHVESEFGFLLHFSFIFFVPSQRKTASVFEQAKTSGCTLASHVILERFYPNKARSNTIPLWLPNGLGIILTITLGASGLFSDFPDFLAEYNT